MISGSSLLALNEEPTASSVLSVWGIPLNLAQYQWLFSDLHALNIEECARHWINHGRREVACLKRRPAVERLSQIQAQRFSNFPDATPSDYIKLDVGVHEFDTLDILFSHCNVPRGHFAFSHVSAGATHSRLSVNVATNDWYQQGIPGVSTSIDETVEFFRRVIDWMGCSYVRTIGCSMGGYAALLFGDLLGVDQVIACDAEVRLGDKLMRSWMWNPSRVYDERHCDVTDAIRRLGSRATISVSAYDPMEAGTAITLLEVGGAPVLSKFFHGTVDHIQWESVLGRPQELAKAYINEAFTIETVSDLALSQAAALYRDACGGIAQAGDEKYSEAREMFESVALYDAIFIAPSMS